MSQSSNNLRLVSWTWQLVNFTQMASTVTRSQSNRAPLGCGGTGDVQLRNLQQLCDTIMSIWTKISEECFQHLVESMLWRIKAVLKAKWVQLGTSKVYLIKWPVSVYVCVCMYSIYIYIYTVHLQEKTLLYTLGVRDWEINAFTLQWLLLFIQQGWNNKRNKKCILNSKSVY